MNFSRAFPGPAELAFNEGQHRYAFQCRPALATADNHFDGRQGSWCGLGAVRFFAGNAAFFEKLQHDIHVVSFAAQLLHEVFQDSLHQLVVFIANRVDGHVAEENRIGSDTQVMLHLAENDLLPAPAMLQDALKPGMLAHRYLAGVAPQLFYECVGSHRNLPCGCAYGSLSGFNPISQARIKAQRVVPEYFPLELVTDVLSIDQVGDIVAEVALIALMGIVRSPDQRILVGYVGG